MRLYPNPDTFLLHHGREWVRSRNHVWHDPKVGCIFTREGGKIQELKLSVEIPEHACWRCREYHLVAVKAHRPRVKAHPC